MQFAVTLVDVSSARSVDVVIDAPATVALKEVVAALLEVAATELEAPDSPGLWVDGAPLDEGALGGSRLRPGCFVTTGPAAGPMAGDAPPGTCELRVIGGPSAGAVYRPGAGSFVIGRDPGADIVLDDASVSRRHAALHVRGGGGVTATDLGSVNGTTIDGTAVTDEVGLPMGAVLRAGNSVLALGRVTGERLLTFPAPGNRRLLHRPPRLAAYVERARIALPAAPDPPTPSPLSVVALVVPVLLGVAMSLALHAWQYLLFTLMSPVIAGATAVSERHGHRRSHRRAVAAHKSARAAAEAELAAAVASDEARRRAAAPDPATVLLAASTPTALAWQRRAGDADALVLRVGLADRPADVDVDPPAARPLARSVPVTVPLADIGVLGVTGSRRQRLALGRWLGAQVVALHSPADVELIVLTTEQYAADWAWVRHVPHVRGDDGRLRVALDRGTAAGLVADVVARSEQRPGNRRTVIVVDAEPDLTRAPGIAAALHRAARPGIHVVCLAESASALPEQCVAMVGGCGDSADVAVRLPETPDVPVLADGVSAGWAEQLGRALSDLDIAGEDEASAVPPRARLLDLLDRDPPTGEAIASRWRRCDHRAEAVVGVGAEGPVTVDLDRDGPHALVAGTTGSGKSELLQTLVVSLALSASPRELQFVLVDYKGGAAFGPCAELPHVVGLVTDLDGRLTERALTSLTAELRRREEVLGAAGARDVAELWRRADSPAELARLVIVVDEFATLAEELPDFVRGLVGIAQRGRSLGIHLVLATQRPSGVVSADIRANANLRVCLRVTQPGESVDVIDTRDAALIPPDLPGRAFVRTAANALTELQCGWLGAARRPGAGTPGVHVAAVRWPEVCRPAAATTRPVTDDAPTDLTVVVDAVVEAAHGTATDVGRRPWLPPLPDAVPVTALASGAPLRPVVGLVDLPGEQAQRPWHFDVEHGGHLLVVGAARSGRSTALRTIAGALAADTDPSDVQMCAIDCSGGALAALADLPHCAAVVTPADPDRVDRLVARLAAEVDRRRSLLAGSGFADIGEQRAAGPAGERLPYLLLLVDRFESFVQTFQDVDAGRLVDELLGLLRDGVAVGLRAVVTADRSGLLGRLPALVPERLVLRLADRGDYGLADIPMRSVPADVPPGRALRAGAAGVVELQFALLDADASGRGQAAALHRLAGRWGRPASTPLRVDPLPLRVTLESVPDAVSSGALGPTARPGALGPTARSGALCATVGVGGDTLGAVTVDLAADGPGFLVAGAPRRGRSTALLTMARSLLDRGTPVVVITPLPSPLRSLAGAPGVLDILTEESPADAWDRCVADVAGPLAVVVDDAERARDLAVAPALDDIARTAAARGWAVVAGGTPEEMHAAFRGFLLDVRRSRCGLLLAPHGPIDGELLGVRLPRGGGGGGSAGAVAGRGVLVRRGERLAVQVATTAG